MSIYISKFRKFLRKVRGRVKNQLEPKSAQLFPLNPELYLPEGMSESDLFDFLKSVRVSNAPPQEMENYCKQDFRRFVYTYGLVKDLSGNCLELGANPYFTTILLQEFTQFKLSLANYFGSNLGNTVIQEVKYKDS
jgi:hypothetical protein